MNENTLMTEPATTTTEGPPDSQSAAISATQGEQPQGAKPVAQSQQTSEGNSTEAKQPKGDKTEGDKEGEGKTDAPEKYEFKAVEGSDVSTETLTDFSEVAKELGLPQDAAQKILDKMAPALARHQMARMEKVKAEWADTSTHDKEFGGDKLAENLAIAKKAMDSFGSPELRSLLNESGLGNHPDVIRFMYRAGKAISEDGFVSGASAKAFANTQAKVLFPNQA